MMAQSYSYVLDLSQHKSVGNGPMYLYAVHRFIITNTFIGKYVAEVLWHRSFSVR